MKAIKLVHIFFLLFIVIIFIITACSAQPKSKLPDGSPPSNSDETSSSILNNMTSPVYEQSTDSQKSNPFPKKGIPVLMYHSISTDPDNALCVSEEQFKEEMEWLYTQDYHTLSIDEFFQALVQGASVPDNPILITFDDGYSDNYQTAWPILKQYEFHGTFFIFTNRVGPKSIDWNQLKELVEQGNSIGSHSVHHYDLKTLTEKQQEEELRESKQILENQLGITINAFCFPSGQYNKTTLELLSKLGYTLSFTTKPGRVHLNDNQFELKRIRIWNGMSLSGFINLVS